jgi:hypothetical protein
MNHPVSHSPRLICRAVRGWQSVFGDAAAAPITGPGSGHAAQCEDCRRYFNAGRALEASLRRGAFRQRQAVPADLEQRIIRAVRQSAPPPPRRTLTGLVPLALAGAVAALAVVLSLPPRAPAPVKTGSPVASRPAATAVADVPVPDALWARISPQAGTLLQGKPLQDEVDSVYADAQSALHFLALNFLPGNPAQPAGAGQRPAAL